MLAKINEKVTIWRVLAFQKNQKVAFGVVFVFSNFLSSFVFSTQQRKRKRTENQKNKNAAIKETSQTKRRGNTQTHTECEKQHMNNMKNTHTHKTQQRRGPMTPTCTNNLGAIKKPSPERDDIITTSTTTKSQRVTRRSQNINKRRTSANNYTDRDLNDSTGLNYSIDR